MNADTKVVRINNSVSLRCYFVKANKKVNWLAIHNNESDAIRAMNWAAEKYGGKAIQVLNRRRGLQRALKGGYGRYVYVYDPNRIFTNLGIIKTVLHYNVYYARRSRRSRRILRRVVRNLAYTVRRKFLKSFSLSRKRYMIALHNNMSSGKVSINQYHKKKGYYIFQNPFEDPKNFVLTIRYKDFKILAKQGLNVVYQAKAGRKQNDGSLSYYCHKKGFLYLNIETRFGKLEDQKRIIKIIMENLIKNQ